MNFSIVHAVAAGEKDAPVAAQHEGQVVSHSKELAKEHATLWALQAKVVHRAHLHQHSIESSVRNTLNDAVSAIANRKRAQPEQLKQV